MTKKLCSFFVLLLITQFISATKISFALQENNGSGVVNPINAIDTAKTLGGDLTNSTNTVVNEVTDAFEIASQKLGAALLLIVGLVFLLLGFRLFRVTFFVAAFFFVGAICYFFLHKYQPGTLDFKDQILISGAIGIVAGLIAMFVINVGFFLGGCILGFFLTTFILTIVVPYQGSSTSLLMLLSQPYQYYLIVFLGALATGLLALTNRFQKFIIITGTSLAGSFCVMCFIDYFAKTGFSASITTILVSAKDGNITNTSIKNNAWGLLVGCILLAVIGVILQYNIFGKTMCCRRQVRGKENVDGYKI
jgi:hypothetical protein